MIHAAGEDLQHRVEDFRCGDPKAVHKPALDSAFAEEARHLFAAAMNDDQRMTLIPEIGQFGARRPRESASSSRVPPNLMSSFKAGLLSLESEDKIHVLHGLAGCAFPRGCRYN